MFSDCYCHENFVFDVWMYIFLKIRSITTPSAYPGQFSILYFQDFQRINILTCVLCFLQASIFLEVRINTYTISPWQCVISTLSLSQNQCQSRTMGALAVLFTFALCWGEDPDTGFLLFLSRCLHPSPRSCHISLFPWAIKEALH